MSNPANSPLKKAQGLNAPQYFDDATDQWEFAKGKAGSLHVKDAEIKAELELIKQRLTNSYVGSSSKAKPVGKEGDSYVELDTKRVFLHNGVNWGEF